MDSKFTKPKGFGEILDFTFTISKKHFKDFFLILLILMGPVYLLEAVIQLFSGVHFFRGVGTGNGWFEKGLSSFAESGTFEASSISADIGLIITAIVGFLLFPVAEAAVLFGVNHIRKDEEFSVAMVMKEAFSRFWPMLGSSILFGLITMGLILVPVGIIAAAGFGLAAIKHPLLGILSGLVLFLAFALVIGLLLTRWSFYFASVVLDRQSPGFSRSWRLTKKRTWPLLGLYIVFYLIISSISFAVQVTLGVSLGNSVMLSIISNLVTILTTMFFSVGYAVMYLDLKTRHDADDIKEMIEDYHIN
ncbi:hypothetical protein ABES02_05790 [Neobacillus pocheonensis]|uniref:hypothetical protein n=1 Tax=Neobacillus pocheonensis TaxID=363869 RepID=UPI003D28408E